VSSDVGDVVSDCQLSLKLCDPGDADLEIPLRTREGRSPIVEARGSWRGRRGRLLSWQDEDVQKEKSAI
jgi:hypothetical protein